MIAAAVLLEASAAVAAGWVLVAAVGLEAVAAGVAAAGWVLVAAVVLLL